MLLGAVFMTGTPVQRADWVLRSVSSGRTSGPEGPELYSLNHLGRFVRVKGNLQVWQAESVRRAYEMGLKRAGLFVTRGRTIGVGERPV